MNGYECMSPESEIEDVLHSLQENLGLESDVEKRSMYGRDARYLDLESGTANPAGLHSRCRSGVRWYDLSVA